MFNSNLCFRFGKSAGLILFATSCLNGMIIDKVDANSSLDADEENIEAEQNLNLAEIKIFCSTILDSKNLQEIFPEFIIETESLTNLELENRAEILATCPQAEKVIILKSRERDNFIAKRGTIAETITKFYIDDGYINSRAILYSSQDILIDEGQVDVIVQGTNRLRKYVRDRITPAANPFNTRDIEDSLRLLKVDPLVENIEATLKPNEETNTSELIVNVTAAKSFFGSFGIDNYSPPSVGSEKLNFNLGYRNLTGIGDTLAIAYNPRIEAFDGTYNLGFNYQAPLNSMNGTLELGVSIDRNEVVEGDFESLDIRGESETYSITYRQPLILNPREELALSIGFSYRDGQTFTFQGGFPFGIGPDEDGISRTSVFNLGQEYTLRDTSGAWGFRSLFRIGVDIFDATDNDVPDENGDYPPDGQFFSWLAQIQRVQVLNNNNFLIIQADLQLTPHSLLPSEQFAIGGGQSVRGYRQNVRSGDNGFRFSIEDRITIAKNDAEQPVFVIAPFFNMGAVWNVENNPNQVPDDNFVAALGLGLLWQPVEGLNLRLDYAPPLIDLDDRGDNVQDDGLHFSVNYSF
ncbi:MAG: ShlB/FhaC/HecB family hemolysin secretion/activation protein [Xenococcaceae cyanobacterium MO_207.B15]|nr:ShlB/FhaC/HecB family hemolysin secretion/activation protein [Xenococcaceae cyanobacterium MO_207.B15]